MSDEQKARGGLGGIGDGIRTGIGVLSAFKQAIEETLQEAVDRGDLSPERARQAMRDAAQRMQGALDEMRERVDFAPQREIEELRAEVSALRERVERLEQERPGGGDDSPPAEDSGIILTE